MVQRSVVGVEWAVPGRAVHGVSEDMGGIVFTLGFPVNGGFSRGRQGKTGG